MGIRRAEIGGGGRAIVQPRTAGPDPLAGAVTGALADLGGQLQQRLRQDQRDKDLVTSVEDRGKYLAAVDERVSELDPAAPDYVQRVQEVYEQTANETLGGTTITDRAVRADLTQRLTALKSEAVVRAQVAQRESTQNRALATLEDAQNSMVARIEEDPDGAVEYEATFFDDFDTIAGTVFTPTQREAMIDEIEVQGTMARIRGLTRAGRREEADAFLEANAGLFTSAQRKALERDVRVLDGQVEAASHEANMNAVADLEVGIIQGTVNVQDVERAEAAGVFSTNPRLKAVLLRQIQTRDRRIMADLEARIDVVNRFEAGLGLKNRAEAETVWQARAAELGPDATPQQIIQEMANVTAQAGVMPETSYRMVRAGNSSDQPGQVAAAAEIHAAIVRQSPTVDTGAVPRVQAVAAASRLLGLSTIQAAQMILANEPDPNARTERNKLFDEEVDFNSEDFLEDLGFDEIPIGMKSDVRTLTRNMFAQTGDIEIAKAAVTELMQRQYGTTFTGGGERTVKQPPELFGLPAGLGGPDNTGRVAELRTDIVDELIEKRLTELGLEPAIPPGTEVTAPAPLAAERLQAGQPPAADLTVTSSKPPWQLTLIEGTNPPQYVVGLLNDFGQYSRVDVWAGATEEEAKATDAWRQWEEKQRALAAQAEKAAKEADEAIKAAPGAMF